MIHVRAQIPVLIDMCAYECSSSKNTTESCLRPPSSVHSGTVLRAMNSAGSLHISSTKYATATRRLKRQSDRPSHSVASHLPHARPAWYDSLPSMLAKLCAVSVTPMATASCWRDLNHCTTRTPCATMTVLSPTPNKARPAIAMAKLLDATPRANNN